MKQQELNMPGRACDKCGQKESCQDIYRQLGNTRGKSIVRHVLSAFVLPLVIFIAALAISQRILEKYMDTEVLRTVIALLTAFTVAVISVIIIRMIGKRLGGKMEKPG